MKAKKLFMTILFTTIFLYLADAEVCEDLCLTPATIYGTLKYPNGTPIPDTEVSVYVNGTLSKAIETDEKGVYVLLPSFCGKKALVELRANVNNETFSQYTYISCDETKKVDIYATHECVPCSAEITGTVYKNNKSVDASITAQINEKSIKTQTTNGKYKITFNICANRDNELKIMANVSGRAYEDSTTIYCGKNEFDLNIGRCARCPLMTKIMGSIKYKDNNPLRKSRFTLRVGDNRFSLTTDNEGKYGTTLEDMCYGKEKAEIEVEINNKVYSNSTEISCGESAVLNLISPVDVKQITEKEYNLKHKNDENQNFMYILIGVVIIMVFILGLWIGKRKR